MSLRPTSSSSGLPPTAPPTTRLSAVLAVGVQTKEPVVDELAGLGLKEWQPPRLGQQMPFSPSRTAQVFVDRLAIFITRTTVEKPPQSGKKPLIVGWAVVEEQVFVAYYGSVTKAFKDQIKRGKPTYLYTRPDESAPFRFNGRIKPVKLKEFPGGKAYIAFELVEVTRAMFKANLKWFA